MRWVSYSLQFKMVKLQTVLKYQGTSMNIPAAMHSRQDPGVNALRSKDQVSVSVPTEVKEPLREAGKLKHHYTIVSVCPAPNILFSSAAFCAAFATFLAFLISSFLITATVALALGVPTSCIQGIQEGRSLAGCNPCWTVSKIQ